MIPPPPPPHASPGLGRHQDLPVDPRRRHRDPPPHPPRASRRAHRRLVQPPPLASSPPAPPEGPERSSPASFAPSAAGEGRLPPRTTCRRRRRQGRATPATANTSCSNPTASSIHTQGRPTSTPPRGRQTAPHVQDNYKGSDGTTAQHVVGIASGDAMRGARL